MKDFQDQKRNGPRLQILLNVSSISSTSQLNEDDLFHLPIEMKANIPPYSKKRKRKNKNKEIQDSRFDEFCLTFSCYVEVAT